MIAGRRFRWAELQILELEKCRTEEHVKDALDTIPETLEKTYRRILDGFDRRDVPLARQILIIICLSPGPLDLRTIASLVDLDPNFVLEICTTSLVSESDDKVRVAHFSVQEFLIVSEKDDRHHACQFSLRDGHIFLATKLVSRLVEHTDLLTTENDIDAHKLVSMRYAAKHWYNHVVALGDIDGSCPDLQLKIDLLFTEPNVYYNWVRMSHQSDLGLHKTLSQLARGYGPPICRASGMGLPEVVDGLLKRGADPNTDYPGRAYGNALQAASHNGHKRIVQTLLDGGAYANAEGGMAGNALQAASIQGHEEIVQILLDRGADVNAKGGTYGSALQGASALGQERIVQMLLNRGADVNVNVEEIVYGSALQAASTQGHRKIVRMLLDRGAVFL